MSDNLKKMREPFPPNQISLLPKPTKKREEMDRIPKARCSECGGWHATSSVIHLSYVGHAALTDRLLDTDPMWSWEPLAMTDGLPVMDSFGGMWIRLTVCGVTRLGYGHAGEKAGGDAIKEVIGDALRNAAMRFGAALELWHKGDLHAHEADEPAKEEIPSASGAAVKEAAFKSLQPEIQDLLRKTVPRIVLFASHKDFQGVANVVQEVNDNLPDEDPNTLKLGLWWLLDSKTRTAISSAEKR